MGKQGYTGSARRNVAVFLFCCALSAALLLFASQCSPLSPFNAWCDSNAFFTVGKGMMNGLVPYRDLFEQKGPLLYLIHGLGYLISNASFHGVYLFEVLAMTVFLFYSCRTVELYLPLPAAVAIAPVLAALIVNSPAFGPGDSAEEFALPFIAATLYHLLHWLKEGRGQRMSRGRLLACGVLAGCVFWMKYSLVGLWLGVCLSIAVVAAVHRRYKDIAVSALLIGLGFLAASAPWLLYFGAHGALDDLFEVYLWINLTRYSTASGGAGVFGVFYNVAYGFGGNGRRNLPLFIASAALLLPFLADRRYLEKALPRVALLLCAFSHLFLIYGGGRSYLYYILAVTPAAVLGLIWLWGALRDLAACLIGDRKRKGRAQWAVAVLCVLLAVSYTARYTRSGYMLRAGRDEVVQHRFAAIINAEPGATLLHYGSLDGGFYTAANLVPGVKYFQNQNIPYESYPVIMDEQMRYVRERETEFVVMRLLSEQDALALTVPYLYENYTLVAQAVDELIDPQFQYVLFQVK